MLDPNKTLAEAQALSKRGMSVIPLQAKKKKPALPEWKTYQSDIASPHTVIEWFANDARNLGIITGAISNVVVLDVDNLDGLLTIDPLPVTPTVITGKGRHYYFQHPGFDVDNIKIDGLGEVRGDGGYVVAPPSIHGDTGRRYTWEVGLDAKLAPLPKWLLEKLQQREVPQVGTSYEPSSSYGMAALRGECEKLAAAHKGSRNLDLNTAACKLGNLVASGELTEHDMRAGLMDACIKNGLVYDPDGGYQGVVQTINSGLAKGIKHPRQRVDVLNTVAEYSAKAGRLKIVSLADVEMQKVDWLWPGVLARGSVAMLAGPPGLGKSQVTLDMAARISVGGQWPVTGERAPQGNVLILSLEDVPEYTIKPRLVACGADLTKVQLITTIADDDGTERQFNLQRDLRLLEEHIEAIGDVQLVVIDPASAYMGKADTNNSGDVRGITTQLSALAQKFNLCILMVSHLNKDEGKGATNRVQGSVSWVGAARTGFMIARDGDEPDMRTMTPIKNNLADDQTAYRFSVQSKQVGNEITTSHVVWHDASLRKTADQVLAERGDGGVAMREAKEFLSVMLRDGPMSYADISAAQHDAGISRGTLHNAKDALGITIEQDPSDKRRTLWRMPKAA